MKRIFFLIIVFFFTTGFFKSALEECADIKARSFGHFNYQGEYEWVDMTESEKLIEKKKYNTAKEKCELSVKIKKKRYTRECNKFYFDYGAGPAVKKQVKIRDISEEENEKAYKKFIKQSLKTKMKDPWYEGEYKVCIKMKKSNPELFKAKYD